MMYSITLCLTLCLVSLSVARIGIPKDQSMNAPFPSPVYKASQHLPAGHLMPLGYQRRPDGPIREELEMPGSREFYDKFVKQDIPVVFRKGITEVPAFNTWTEDQYLIERYGQLNMTVRMRVTRALSRIITTEEVIKFKKFLNDFNYDSLYLESILPKDMMPELPFPKCVRCGTTSDNLISAHLWMSSGVTSSRVRSYDDHLLYCVIFGRRDFILIENIYKNAFPYTSDYPESMGGYTDFDTEMVNVLDYKIVPRIPWTWATLYPEECLFVPAGYLHHIRSYGRSISLAIEFSRITEFDDTGCHLIEKEFEPLSDAYFLLAFENGRLRLNDLEITIEKLRHILISLIDKSGFLKLERFAHFYNRVVEEDAQIPSAKSVFGIICSNKRDNQLTKHDILNLSSSALQDVVNIFNNAYANIRRKSESLTRAKKVELSNEDTEVLMHLEL